MTTITTISLIRKTVDMGLGHYYLSIQAIIQDAREGHYLAEFEFNGITLEARPDSCVEDIYHIYMLNREIFRLKKGIK